LSSPPYGDINDDIATYIQQTVSVWFSCIGGVSLTWYQYNKTIVIWSDDSGDSTGGTAQQSYDFYAQWAAQGPGHPHMCLSHETEPAGIGALKNGTVQLLANAKINMTTVAQCLDQDPYEYVGGYGTKDSSWNCTAPWTPP
jgi:hypothetical protein